MIKRMVWHPHTTATRSGAEATKMMTSRCGFGKSLQGSRKHAKVGWPRCPWRSVIGGSQEDPLGLYRYLPLPEYGKRAVPPRVPSTGWPVAKTTADWGFLRAFASHVCAVVGPAHRKAAVKSTLSAGFSAAGISGRAKQGTRGRIPRYRVRVRGSQL